MGWLTEWRRRRVLQKHAIDEALWRRATGGLRFLPRSEKLKSLTLLFLAEQELAGESMAGGPEVTPWDAAAHDPYINVKIDAVVDTLEMVIGAADGMPPLHPDMDVRAWTAAFTEAYEGFCDALERGQDIWLDPYAAEHPSEFFAVVSEAFFEDPAETKRRYPDVYEQLRRFYRQDPAAPARR